VALVPSLVAGAGLAAVNRPGQRSTALGLALGVYLLGLLLAVPVLGATGAGLAGLASALTAATYNVLAARRLMGVRARHFLLLQRGDLDFARSLLLGMLGRMRGRGTA
jgi:O-antigen/teichoic acid export membrane protein